MTGRIRFVVPGRPHAKQRPRVVHHHGATRAYTPGATMRAEALIREAFRWEAGDGFRPHDGPVDLFVEAHYRPPKSWPKWKRKAALEDRPWPAPRYSDWDNLGKVVSDALNGVAYVDDRQIVRAVVEKRRGHHDQLAITLFFWEPLPALKSDWEGDEDAE